MKKLLFIIMAFVFCAINLSHAANAQLKDSVVEGDLAGVNQHLTHANKNNPLDENGLTPLHLAALYGHKDIVKKLVSLGANINARDALNTTPFMQAAGNGHVTVMQLLKNYGANINAQDAAGMTALHYAVARSQADAIESLLAMRVNKNLKDSGGMTPEDMARKNGKSELVQLFSRSQIAERKAPPPKPKPTINGKPVSGTTNYAGQKEEYMKMLRQMRDKQSAKSSMSEAELGEKLIGKWYSPSSYEDVEFKADGTVEVTYYGHIGESYEERPKCYYKWEIIEPGKIRLERILINNRYKPPIEMHVAIRADRLALPTRKITGASSLKRGDSEELLEVRKKRQARVQKNMQNHRRELSCNDFN